MVVKVDVFDARQAHLRDAVERQEVHVGDDTLVDDDEPRLPVAHGQFKVVVGDLGRGFVFFRRPCKSVKDVLVHIYLKRKG